MSYDLVRHRSIDCGYRNINVIKDYVQWAAKIIQDKYPKERYALLGSKSSGAYLGIALASAINGIYVDIESIKQKLGVNDDYFLSTDIQPTILIFVDDYIHSRSTFDSFVFITDHEKYDLLKRMAIVIDASIYSRQRVSETLEFYYKSL